MRMPSTITVELPDLFVGFLSERPSLNVNYVAAKAKSEEKVLRSPTYSDRQKKGVMKCDFAYFASIMAPTADLSLLCIICDWGNWIFPFDDMFDNGQLSEDAISAQLVMFCLKGSLDAKPRRSKTSSVVGDPMDQAYALVELHDGIFDAITGHCSTATKFRYVDSMHKYCVGTSTQVFQAEVARIASFEDVLAQRRQSVCVAPLFALIELGHKISLPDEAFDNVEVRHLEQLGIEITLLHNDLLSYCKEEDEGVLHNTVMACRLQGMGAQEAMTFVGTEASRRVRDFEETIIRLRSSSLDDLSEVIRYVKGIQDVVRANLYWSFQTDRFFSNHQKTGLFGDGTLTVARVIISCPRTTTYVASSLLLS